LNQLRENLPHDQAFLKSINFDSFT